jgi:hypothetical protein
VKRIVLVAMVLAVLLAGCNGVILNPEYSSLLDETTALSRETARRAEAGLLDPNVMVHALRAQANAWQYFQDARDGRGPGE